MSNKFQVLRDSNDGKLPAYAWPGGYQIIYIDEENNVLCSDCADKNDNLPYNPRLVTYDIYYEGPTIQCEGCNCDIESTYGDPDEEDE